MTEDSTAPEAATDGVPERPADVPEKFWDAATGAVRTEALLKSYAELERKLGSTGQDGELSEAARARLLDMLGRPATPDEYRIEPPHEAVTPDPEVNARLHAAGFTQAQAQLVYELAAERLLPVIAQMAAELEGQRQVDRLQRHFGGPENSGVVMALDVRPRPPGLRRRGVRLMSRRAGDGAAQTTVGRL